MLDRIMTCPIFRAHPHAGGTEPGQIAQRRRDVRMVDLTDHFFLLGLLLLLFRLGSRQFVGRLEVGRVRSVLPHRGTVLAQG